MSPTAAFDCFAVCVSYACSVFNGSRQPCYFIDFLQAKYLEYRCHFQVGYPSSAFTSAEDVSKTGCS